MTTPLILVLAALVVMGPVAGRADDGVDDHERARALYEHGEIESLHDVLERVKGRIGGDIVAIDLVLVEGRWTYRLQILAADGRRTTLDVDAHELAEGMEKEDDD